MKWLFLGFLAILFSGCDSRTAREIPESRKVTETGQASPAKAAWEEDWEKALKAAQKEKRVVVYASSVSAALKEAAPLFKKKYGFDIELVSATGAQITPKLLMERANGLFLVDVLIAGPGNVIGDFKPAGALDSVASALILPEVLDPKLWFEGKFPWADKDKLVVYFFYYPLAEIGVNTDLVKAEEIKSLFDLLNPKWKGKITLNDPTVGSGIGFTSFSSTLYHKVVNLDFFRQFVRQEPVMLSDQRLQVDWLARGKYPLALWPRSINVAEYKSAGSPIDMVFAKEATPLSVDGGGLALMNRAPHPDAARVFINWFLSREGQLIMQKSTQQHSAREDISTQGLDPLQTRQPGRKYFRQANTIEEWYLEKDNYVSMAKEIFSPLLK